MVKLKSLKSQLYRKFHFEGVFCQIWFPVCTTVKTEKVPYSKYFIEKTSVVEPEPDFLAGAGAGEKAPAPGCCCLA